MKGLRLCDQVIRENPDFSKSLFHHKRESSNQCYVFLPPRIADAISQRGFGFTPQTLDEFPCRWQILYKLNTSTGV
jgi:hypothetical protein